MAAPAVEDHRWLMRTLTTLLTTLALSTTLGLAGCKKDETKNNAPATTETAAPKTTDTPADPATPPTTADTKPTEAQPAATGDIPAECNEYKAGIEKLASCDKLPPETKETLKKAYEQAAAGWANVPAEGKAAVASACKSGADALKQAAAACQ
jgi:hypothetical protein